MPGRSSSRGNGLTSRTSSRPRWAPSSERSEKGLRRARRERAAPLQLPLFGALFLGVLLRRAPEARDPGLRRARRERARPVGGEPHKLAVKLAHLAPKRPERLRCRALADGCKRRSIARNPRRERRRLPPP